MCRIDHNTFGNQHMNFKRQMLRADIEMYRISNTLIEDPLYKVWCLFGTQTRVQNPGAGLQTGI